MCVRVYACMRVCVYMCMLCVHTRVSGLPCWLVLCLDVSHLLCLQEVQACAMALILATSPNQQVCLCACVCCMCACMSVCVCTLCVCVCVCVCVLACLSVHVVCACVCVCVLACLSVHVVFVVMTRPLCIDWPFTAHSCTTQSHCVCTHRRVFAE